MTKFKLRGDRSETDYYDALVRADLKRRQRDSVRSVLILLVFIPVAVILISLAFAN